ncbi:HAMP domain-containing histidine kinase (plasmid) [Peteryoungia desertarenae]|uniref:histidine kinase n=1 Tax=Peteryoungia desertarenae TaxID=1813451 RepID=A0ABX6QT94_9HYPH|nr:HAMP domain-containing sensor histidine kinase [Peteryoungia desertarenae]QLF71652.1 HAMP domain-containing histidine kinase [Peteryoungia desertarenae]
MQLHSDNTSFGYVTQLRLAFLGLAVPTVLLALAGWYVLEQSQYRVERGRIASDIYTALMGFDVEKAALRNWSFRRTLAQNAAAEERSAILERMAEKIELISEKAELAFALDSSRRKTLEEHREREKLIVFLDDVIEKLDMETALLISDQPASAIQIARVEAQFNQFHGVSPAEALKKALATEAIALEAERNRANDALTTARQLFLLAGGFGLFGTLIPAAFLVTRFRQPLKQMEEGLQAYQNGDFSYRFDRFRDVEFKSLGRQLNAMAAEVDLARKRAAENRMELEQTVAIRTAELRRTVDELAASEGSRAKLLADVGHELRTPVTVIRGEAQVALRLKSRDSQPYRAALERIVAVSRQMGHLIEDILVLVRNPSSEPLLELKAVRLGDVVASAVETARSAAAFHNVSVSSPETLPATVIRADQHRLRQVLVCLLDNAVRYSYAGGEVTLFVGEEEGGHVSVSILDRGLGINTEDLPYLFDRGWRAKEARAHRPDGLGLGLSIARKLTEAQGGRLVIRKGEDGCGTLAQLIMPALPAIPATEVQ